MATVNSGLTMRIMPRGLYDFSGLQAAGKSTITIAQHIDASVFQEADILVRFHTGTVIGAGANIIVGLVTDGYDFSDPAPLTAAGAAAGFFGNNPTAGSPGAVQVLPATNLPSFMLASMNQGQTTTPFGRMLAILMIATQGA